MIAAIESVKGGQSVKRAAEEHGVPRTTLQDCVKGKVVHGVNPGPQPYLQPADENVSLQRLQQLGTEEQRNK